MGNTRTPNRAIELLALALEWQRSSIIERLRLRRELQAIRFEEYMNGKKTNEAKDSRDSRQINQ